MHGTPTDSRYPHIDAMRGIAALLVACIHISESFAPVASSGRWLHLIARDFAFGGIGVSLFFLVSGFVIPSSLKLGNSRLPELRQFVVRRFFRLYPVYWLSIALAVLIKFWIWNRDVELARILANVTMLQRFLGYEDIEGLYWTLATELVFYGLCAALFLAGVLNNARLLIAAALLFAAVYYPDVLLGVPVRHGPLWFMFHTDISANLALMFVGAVLRKWHDGQPIEGWVKFLLVCLIGVMMYPLTKSVTIVNEAIAWRFPPGGGRAIGLLIFLNLGLGLRLRHPVLTLLGEASYSIYLFHPVLIYGVLWVLARPGMEGATGQHLGIYVILVLALTILWSLITYRWVEKPMIALGRRLGSASRTRNKHIIIPPPNRTITSGDVPGIGEAAREVIDRGTLNLARGIGIVAVVFGHVNPGFGPSVGTFHMPLFFFLGGITMLPDRPWKSVLHFVWRDLILFAILMSGAYAVVGAILNRTLGLQFNGRPLWDIPLFTTDILVQTAHAVPLALTAWFLIAYAGAVVLCQFLLKRVRRNLVAVCFALGLVLYVAGVKLIAPQFTHHPDTWYFNYATQVVVGSGFMLFGVAFARFCWPTGMLKSPATLLLLLLAYRALIWQFHPRDIGMVFSEYPAGVLVGGAAALLGTAIVVLLADKFRARWFSWLGSIGAASKHVMAHHLFFLTVVNLLFVAFGWMALGEVQNVYSKFAVRETWPLYLGFGVGGSMVLYAAIGAASVYFTERRRSMDLVSRTRPAAPATASQADIT